VQGFWSRASSHDALLVEERKHPAAFALDHLDALGVGLKLEVGVGPLDVLPESSE
jgi:hypothetical protein